MNGRDNTAALVIGFVAACLALGIGFLYLENERLKMRVAQIELALVQFSTVVEDNIREAAAVSQKNHCINNLRMLDGAIQQWALETKQPTSAEVYLPSVQRYLGVSTECPAGGLYSVGLVTDHPACSIQGHALPYFLSTFDR